MQLEDFVAPAERDPATASPVWPVTAEGARAREGLAGVAARWMATTGFKADAGDVLLVPDEEGGVAGAVLGLGDGDDPFVAGSLARKLPAGDWRIEAAGPIDLRLASLGFLLGAYRFER